MESFWRSTAVTLGKRWQLVLVAVLAVTGVLAIGATNLEFATGQDSYLNPDSQIAIDNVEFQDEFGGETVILLFTADEPGVDVADLVSEDNGNLAELRRLGEQLAEVDNVRSVITPAVSLEFSDALVGGLPEDANGIGPGGEALLSAPARDEAGSSVRNADAQISFARRNEIEEPDRRLGNPPWNDLLVYANDGFTAADGEVVAPPDDEREIRLSLAGTFPDPQTAVGGVVLDGNLDLDSQSAATEQVLEILETADVEGFELTVTGSPVYLKEINDYLKGGMLTLGVAALLVMALVLGLMFRVRWRLLPLLAVMVGIAWTFSLMGWIGVDLSLVTISGLPILIGVGIDFAIQIHNRVEEEVVLDHDEHPIGETLANLAPALITATIAGIFAFMALQLSKVPMIRDFGILLGVGIAMLVIVGIVVPASALGIREWTSRTTHRGDSLVERIVVRLGSVPPRLGLGLVVLSLGLFVGGIFAESSTRIESDPIEWVDQGSDVVQDVRRLEDETGFATTLGVIVKANNVYDQEVIDLIHDFTIAAEQRPEVVASSSLVNTMSKILTIDGATVIPPTEEEIVAAAEVMPPDIAEALVNAPIGEVPTAAQVNLRLAPASLEDRAVLVADLEDDLQARIDALDLPADSILLTELPAGQDPVRATPAGLATVGIGLLENLSANRAALTYFALCLAGLFLLLRFRSLSRALLALVPVFLGVGASTLIVGLIGIELSPLTTVSGPLIIASCTEFSVLIMSRYLEERESGLAIRDANHTAASRTGRAFFVSAATTIGGFATLVVSPLPLLRDFGLIVTLNVAIALAAALVVMPPMLSWVDGRGWLGVGDQVDRRHAVRLAAPFPGGQTPGFLVGLVAVVAALIGVYISADTSQGETSTVAYAAVALPTTTTTTTVAPTTTTTTTTAPPPGETVPPGETAPPTAPGTTAPAGPVVDPAQFPDEVPPGAISPALFDLLTGQGVAGNVAHCAIVTAYDAAGGEQALIDLGLLAGSDEALAIVRQASADCGIPTETVEAAITQQFG